MMLGQRVGYAKHKGSGWDSYKVAEFHPTPSTSVIIEAPTGERIDAPLKDIIDFPDEED
jgi:hypothetical protein